MNPTDGSPWMVQILSTSNAVSPPARFARGALTVRTYKHAAPPEQRSESRNVFADRWFLIIRHNKNMYNHTTWTMIRVSIPGRFVLVVMQRWQRVFAGTRK